MQTQWISLDQLEDHPHNSNVMPSDLFEKLKRHIRDTGRYPPLIVRPLPPTPAPESGSESGSGSGSGSSTPDHAPRYQLLDGHHRARAMRQLQHTSASCVVWAVDEAHALVLLATLNRLEGRDDPRKRAALLRELQRRMAVQEMARRLPEDGAGADRMLQLSEAIPPPRPTRGLEQMPMAVHFFLLPEQKRRLESALRAIGGEREAALMRLVEGGGR